MVAGACLEQYSLVTSWDSACCFLWCPLKLLCGCSYKEEANADAAIRALTAALAPKARVLRDGALHVSPSCPARCAGSEG